MEAPDGVIVNEFPEQIAPELAVISGALFTITVDIAVEIQPIELVPVTEYWLVVEGETTDAPDEKV